MTRDEALDTYRPLRAGIQRVLREAPKVCRATELKRAVADIAPWAEQSNLEGTLIEMMMDVALFEPDKRGRRAIDRFVKGDGRKLPGSDRDLLQAMTQAWFSLFRIVGRHEVAGVWLEDLLQADRRIWLMDEGLEASGAPDLILGLRVFDAGPFHAGFGIITQPDDLTLGSCLAAHARRQPLPGGMSLAATIYADHLAVEAPMGVEELDLLNDFAELVFMADAKPPIEHEPRMRRTRAPKRLPKRKSD